MSEPVTMDVFTPVSALVKGHELQPGKHYVVFFDGKKFDHGLAQRLLHKIHEDHPELVVHAIATLEPKGLVVVETTLADQLATAQRKWLEEERGLEGTMDFMTELIPLLNRAIKALRGQNDAT